MQNNVQQILPEDFLESQILLYDVNASIQKQSQNKTIIIDYGRQFTRAGYTTSSEPYLICKSNILKVWQKQNIESYCGNQINNINTRSQSKQVFEGNKNFTDFSSFEDFNDYLFSQLHAQRKDSLIYTEPFCVTEKFRNDCFELYFDCYDFESVMPCIDFLASSYKILTDQKISNSLIIQLGEHETIYMPFIKGKLDYQKTTLNNIGYKTIQNYFANLINNKYININWFYTQNHLQNLLRNKGFVSQNYNSQMKYYQNQSFQQISDYYIYPNYEIWFEVQSSQQNQNESQIINNKVQKFIELQLKEKLTQNQILQERLKKLEDINLTISQLNKEQTSLLLQQNNIKDKEDLQFKINKVKDKLNLEHKIDLKEKHQELFNKNEDELSIQEKKRKRFLQILIDLKVKRQKAKAQKKIEKEQKLKDIQNNPEKFIQSLIQSRQSYIEKWKQIQQIQSDVHLKQLRSHLKAQQCNSNGQNSYKMDIQNAQLQEFYDELVEISSDEEKYIQKIEKVENQIKELNPIINFDYSYPYNSLSSSYQTASSIFIGQDLTWSCEIMFKPYIAGFQQQGIIDTINNIAQQYDQQVNNSLINNIYLIGQASNVVGLQKWIEHELSLQYKIDVQINKYSDLKQHYSYVHTYQSLYKFYNDFDKEKHQSWSYSKKEYQEYGSNLFKRCPIGNM